MDNNIVFSKIGGSCLTGIRSIRNLTDIYSGNAKNVFILSAFTGVTDGLYLSSTDAGKRQEYADYCLKQHIRLLEGALGKNIPEYGTRMLEHSIMDFINSGSDSNYVNLDNVDSYLSIGERLSAATCSLFLKESGFRSTYISSDELGLIATYSGNDVIADVPASIAAIRSKLNDLFRTNDLILTTGFFARDRFGNIRTFGRNSSDYSAVAIAAASGSSKVILYKDVDGIYQHDPKTFKDGNVLHKIISHEKVLNEVPTSYKIVHPRAVSFALECSIDLQVKNYFNPLSEGTLITTQKVG